MGRKALQGSTGTAQKHPEERGEVHGSFSPMVEATQVLLLCRRGSLPCTGLHQVPVALGAGAARGAVGICDLSRAAGTALPRLLHAPCRKPHVLPLLLLLVFIAVEKRKKATA